MKKFLYYTAIIVSIILILISLYLFVKIHFEFSQVDGQMYDGFGEPYVNNEPSSRYTIWCYGSFIAGISLVYVAREKCKEKD